MNKTVLSLLAAMSASVVVAQNSVNYTVQPVSTYPAEGACIESLDRVVIDLGRGFGPVGVKDLSTNVYLIGPDGFPRQLSNAVGGDLEIKPDWRLQEYDGASARNVHTYKDCLYNDLFTRTHGWNGGDGVFTVGLPGGHVYWTFNDSFYGVVDGATRARGACSFPRNTIMVQEADADGYPVTTDDGLLWLADFVQTTNPSAPGYYKALTHLDHPKAVSYNDDGIAQDYVYWSGDGAIVDGKLQMLWQGVYSSELRQESTALVTYSLEGEPGDESYLKIESVNHNLVPYNPFAYGSTLWEDEDGHIYLYSAVGNGTWFGNDPIVARTVSYDLNSEWEFYVADASGKFAWQRRYPTQDEVQRSGISPGQGSFTLPWVFKKGNRYFMCAQTFPFGQEMAIMTSDTPWGPFKNKKILISFPNPLDELQHDLYSSRYRFLYMLNLHPALSREGELVISTNTDPADTSEGAGDAFWRNFNNPGSADWYRPFYYRVYGWESLFAGTMEGANDRLEFTTGDRRPITQPGRYKIVCEQGAFGNEQYEAGGYQSGTANNRIEVNFTIGDPSGIAAPEADNAAPEADN
nr:DUF5005 domain-containing protein [Muribaculaceae bacterium]